MKKIELPKELSDVFEWVCNPLEYIESHDIPLSEKGYLWKYFWDRRRYMLLEGFDKIRTLELNRNKLLPFIIKLDRAGVIEICDEISKLRCYLKENNINPFYLNREIVLDFGDE